MKTRFWLAAILIGLGAVFAVIRASQPNPDLLRFETVDMRAYGYGFTDDRSVSYMARFIKTHPQVKTLVLKNMPGTRDADMNLRLARHIRRAALNTHLQADSFIASGAVDLFLAGRERTLECGAQIGVHSWGYAGLGHAAQDGRDSRQNIQEKFLTDMGINPDFYTFTRDAAPPDSIHILTYEEIERFGLLTQPHNCTHTEPSTR